MPHSTQFWLAPLGWIGAGATVEVVLVVREATPVHKILSPGIRG